MNFPTFDDFSRDRRISLSVFRVYMRAKDELDFVQPRQLLVWKLCEETGLGRAAVIRGLNWLVRNAYLVEHNRGERRIRHFTLVWSRAKQHAA